MARDPAPIPDEFFPTVIPRRPIDVIDALEDEIAKHIDTIKTTATQEQVPMQDRPAPAAPSPPSPYAPPQPRPVPSPASTAIQNMPSPQQPASQMDVRFNGKTLILSATCNTSAEAERVIETLTPLSKLLPSE
jgi:hypothetical protein